MASGSFVYIAANLQRQVFVWVAKDLDFAMYLHKRGDVSDRLARLNIDRLVYLEEFGSLIEANKRQETLRRMRRGKRAALIERKNPDWHDLSHVPELVPAGPTQVSSGPDAESEGGVPASVVPRGGPPRSASEAKSWPDPVE